SPLVFLLRILPPPCSPLFPYTTLFRSVSCFSSGSPSGARSGRQPPRSSRQESASSSSHPPRRSRAYPCCSSSASPAPRSCPTTADRKSTRLNSSHDQISYAVFCLKKKK